MKKKEFPETMKETQSLMDELSSMAEFEPDKERRRELFLLQIELREHLMYLEIKSKMKRRSLKKN